MFAETLDTNSKCYFALCFNDSLRIYLAAITKMIALGHDDCDDHEPQLCGFSLLLHVEIVELCRVAGWHVCNYFNNLVQMESDPL